MTGNTSHNKSTIQCYFCISSRENHLNLMTHPTLLPLTILMTSFSIFDCVAFSRQIELLRRFPLSLPRIIYNNTLYRVGRFRLGNSSITGACFFIRYSSSRAVSPRFFISLFLIKIYIIFGLLLNILESIYPHSHTSSEHFTTEADYL